MSLPLEPGAGNLRKEGEGRQTGHQSHIQHCSPSACSKHSWLQTPDRQGVRGRDREGQSSGGVGRGAAVPHLETWPLTSSARVLGKGTEGFCNWSPAALHCACSSAASTVHAGPTNVQP